MYSLGTYLAATSLFILGYLFLRPLALYFWDPLDLRKYPTPSILAATTPLWLMRETYLYRRSRTLHETHERLGDVIRVGPNQLIFNHPQAVADIYGHLAARKIMKDIFYDKMAGSHRNLVTARDHDEHGRKRRYLSNVFALKTVVEMEPVIRKNFQRVLDHMDLACKASPTVNSEKHGECAGPTNTKSLLGAKLDMRDLFNLFTLDVISDMGFSTNLGFVENSSDKCRGETNDGRTYTIASFVPMLHQGIRYNLTLAQIIDLNTNKLFKSISNCSGWMRSVSGRASAVDYESFCRLQLKQRLESGSPDRPMRDFIDRAICDRDGIDRKLPFGELLADTSNMMNAGSETTAAALCSTLWFLTSHPACFEKLRAEIDERFPLSDTSPIVQYDKVRDAPYLRACIDEAMRLRPPIGYALQRLVVDPNGADIAGHHVKAGTVVAVSPFSIQRKKDLYYEADSYNPERWLDENDKDQRHALKAYDLVFSQGPRACIGRHIAIVELQILISSLVRRYDFSLTSKGQQLQTLDLFNANPGPLPLHVKPRAVIIPDL